jgi:hypothetical protein
MKRQEGYSVIELVVASAVLLVTTVSVFRLLDDGVARSTFWNEAADLQQRARVAADTLSSVVHSAGAGPDTGSLSQFFAAVEPKRRTSGGAGTVAITVRHVPANAPRSTLTAPLAPGAGVVNIARHSGCPDGTVACGFDSGMDVVIFDTTGNWDTMLVQSIAPDTLGVVDRPAPRSVTYDSGAQVAQVVESTVYYDGTDGTLRREHPGVSNMPLLDNVVDLQFEYFGDPSPPLTPRPPTGVANCLFDSTGARLTLPTLVADHGPFASLPVAMLTDGPMCGSGATAYDVDLLRIRMIRVEIRLQTGVAMLRGLGSHLFARPGGARASDRMLPDVRLSLAFSPRNLQR